jgi:phage/plasmid-associated DNA primase
MYSIKNGVDKVFVDKNESAGKDPFPQGKASETLGNKPFLKEVQLIEVKTLEIDWGLFRRTLDAAAQYEVLRNIYVNMRRGGFEDEFLLWFGSQVGAKDAEEREKAWRKLRSNEKAHWILVHFLDKDIAHVFFIYDTEIEDFFVQFGYNPKLLDLKSWMDNVAETLYGRVMSEGVKRELLRKLKAIAKPVKRERINPETTLLTSAGIFDMETRRLTDLEDVGEPWFTEYSPLYTYEPVQLDISQREIDDIVGGSYDIESNLVYRLYAPRLPGENLYYVMDALGAILAPIKLKIVLLLLGGTDAGKSAFASVISKPIYPIVSFSRLEDILEYRFGPAELIGKQVLINQEESQTVLRKLRMFNTLFGAYDQQEVPQKFKRAAKLMSLKLGIIIANDPPMIKEYQGETLMAALNRLTIAWMVKGENVENTPFLLRQVNERELTREVFKLLLYCTVQLEKRNWQPRKMDMEKMLDLLKEASNPVYRFLEECPEIVEDPNGRIRFRELYDIYLKWCDKKGLTHLDKDTFESYVARKYEVYYPHNVKTVKGLRKAEEGTQRSIANYELGRFEE